jgi:hypothetical protein
VRHDLVHMIFRRVEPRCACYGHDEVEAVGHALVERRLSRLLVDGRVGARCA